MLMTSTRFWPIFGQLRRGLKIYPRMKYFRIIELRPLVAFQSAEVHSSQVSSQDGHFRRAVKLISLIKFVSAACSVLLIFKAQ